MFTGSIPDFSNCVKLQRLMLAQNALSGTSIMTSTDHRSSMLNCDVLVVAGAAAWKGDQKNYPAKCKVDVGEQQEASAAGEGEGNMGSENDREERAVSIAKTKRRHTVRTLV